MELLNETVCKQLANSLENLTTTRPSNKNEAMNNVKKICRQSDEYVKRSFHILMHQLERDHAEIRLFSLNVIDELFRRSHTFRKELLSDFQTFMELTLEIDPELPLPPPKPVAKDLKFKSCKLIQSWYNLYGSGYKQLELGYKFLKNCKKIDFDNIEATSVAERNREEQQRRQRNIVIQENVRKILVTLPDKQLEIEGCITEFNNAFSLMLQSTDEIFAEDDFLNPQPCCSKVLAANVKHVQDENSVDQEVENDYKSNKTEECDEDNNLLRFHGLGSHKYNLNLEIGIKKGIPISKNNSAILINLKNCVKLITKNYIPMVSRWIEVFTKAEDHRDNLKKAIDIKQALLIVVDKYKDLNINDDELINDSSESEESEDDFIEVPEREDSEEVKTPVDYAIKLENKSDDVNDPTTLLANLKALGEKNFLSVSDYKKSEGSFKKCLKTSDVQHKAPLVRFDVDLINWEGKLEPPTVTKFEGLHRFWQPHENETEEIKKPEDANSLRVRRIDFSGEFKPVKWQCRTPLPSGKLCPRYDRVKCPLHGKVIARDEFGKPTEVEDIERLRIEQEKIDKAKPPDWQDPVLLAEIKAAIGIDLTVGKKSRKKKTKYPDLTDVKEKVTSRKRLEKKVLSRSAVKRVSSTLDNADYKKHKDTYGDQFNYFAE